MFTVNAGSVGGVACFRIRVVDLAGHTADSDLACVTLGGDDPPTMDAGVVDAGRAAPVSVGATSGLDLSGRGCSCETSRAASRDGAFVFALVVLCVIARRRPHPR